MSAPAVVVILSPRPRPNVVNSGDPPAGTIAANVTVKIDGLYADPTVGEVRQYLMDALAQIEQRTNDTPFAGIAGAST